MKNRILHLLPILLLFFSNCEDSKLDTPGFKLSQSAFDNISNTGATLEITVTSDAAWTVASNADWCTPTPGTGAESHKLTLTVEANLNPNQRKATVIITRGDTRKEILLTQQTGDENLMTNYLYRLPVVFHVLYQKESNPTQNVPQERLNAILTKVNMLYKQKNLNMEFTLATKGPDGKTLPEPGIDRVYWTKTYPINCNTFMYDENHTYTYLLWDPNQYINVMLYNFTNNSEDMTTLGISHLPYTVEGAHALPGLTTIPYTHITLSQLSYAHCVSLNSMFCGKEYDDKIQNASITLTHELGHYLGLHHVFSEDEKGNQYNGCIDSDYCEDTPTYNRIEYITWLDELTSDHYTLEFLAQRHNCSGFHFIAHNLMDYAYCFSNEFTTDQRNRVRHVLLYSPLRPGPKIEQQSRAVPEGVLDLPIHVAK